MGAINFKKLPKFFLILIFLFVSNIASAASKNPSLTLAMGDENQMAAAMKIFLFLTLISLGPAMILTMSSFTRIIIVLSFLRQAMGVPQSPPNQVLAGLAFFLTIFLMSPVIKDIHTNAITPFLEEKISQEVAIEKASMPLKAFMFKQTRKPDLELMLKIANEKPINVESLSLFTIVPAFILSELKTAFEIGFLIYLPFVLIDMVVSMILLTMGMMVLPPVVISLPFKLMLFVLIDGWNLVVSSLIRSFQ
ncbi:MAG: flagellar type III secretion system pore protein FliP [Deltaproteobacteria bacterium]|nr:MAG: flagellar type III secretion system pore protein FliP [Deltaproteobacteria bacterium]